MSLGNRFCVSSVLMEGITLTDSVATFQTLGSDRLYRRTAIAPRSRGDRSLLSAPDSFLGGIFTTKGT